MRKRKKAGAEEKQVTLPNGRVVNYGEVANNKPALLLIHGQGGAWEDYALLLSDLSENWHIYAVDVYGHGQSSHNEDSYYIDENGNDLIWFIDNIIKEKDIDICVGGYHLIDPVTKHTVSSDLLDEIAEYLSKWDHTQFYTCHCTGMKAYRYLRDKLTNLNYLYCGETITK